MLVVLVGVLWVKDFCFSGFYCFFRSGDSVGGNVVELVFKGEFV